MAWYFTSATVRLVPKRNSSLSHSLSAVYLVEKNGPTVGRAFCLSICHVPIDQVESHKIYVSVPHVHGNGNVVWLDASIESLAPVLQSHSPLHDYLQHALENGFNFLPLDTLRGNSIISDLNLVKVVCRNVLTEENSHLFQEFSPVSVEPLTPVIVRSSPFNFTNGSMFADFASTGNLNFVLRDGGECHGYLSDIKYLENMSGAPVTTRDGKSVGLLLGNLRKLNGDGDLLVIVPWKRLLSLIPGLIPSVTSNLADAWNLQVLQKPAKASESVFPLTLSRGEKVVSWGSCVLLNLHTLVTNNHVIKPLKDDVKCHVIVNYAPVSITDNVAIPFENLDLAFIRLSEETQAHFAGIQPTKMAFADNLHVGDPVTTAAYGLIYNLKNTEALRSSGYVSAKISQTPFENSPKVPCMIISSAACWNGSSGGGLFNSRGSLVGIICSNAQVFVPGLNGDVASKTEKVPLFCLCIPLELVLECYRVVELQEAATLHPHVEKIWKLESFHEDVFEREVKL